MRFDARVHHSETASADGVQFVIQLPSDLRLIEAVVEYLVGRCRDYLFDGPRLELNFRVGVTEAISNAVLYGNRSDPEKIVRIDVTLDESRVVVLVEDEGVGFDPGVVPDPTLPPHLHSPGGRGLFLIRHLMDGIDFNERGNAVRMVLMREVPSGGSA